MVTATSADRALWMRMYRKMLEIRLFEEQVNALYTTARMPGLAHLYIGEEAVAVGVCEALHLDDYITSTHRGHGHCLAKGAAIPRMFAELLEKKPDIAAARVDQCTLPTRSAATWAPTPLWEAARELPPAPPCPLKCAGRGRWPFASSVKGRWVKACFMK